MFSSQHHPPLFLPKKLQSILVIVVWPTPTWRFLEIGTAVNRSYIHSQDGCIPMAITALGYQRQPTKLATCMCYILPIPPSLIGRLIEMVINRHCNLYRF
jgi:hypothetical protein